MKPRGLLLLAGVSLALVLLAIVDPWKVAPPIALGRIVPQGERVELRSISIDRPGHARVAAKRASDGSFGVTEPVRAPVDQDALRAIEGSLSLLRALRSESRKTSHGLAAPTATIELVLADETHLAIATGRVSEDERFQWIGVGASDAALLVERYLIRDLMEAADRLASRELVSADALRQPTLRVALGPRWLERHGAALRWGQGPDEAGRSGRVSSASWDAFVASLRALRFDALELRPPSCQDGTALLQIDSAEGPIADCGACDGTRERLAVGTRSGCVDTEEIEAARAFVTRPEGLIDTAVLPTRAPTDSFRIACGARQLEVDPAHSDRQSLAAWWRRLDGAASGPELAATVVGANAAAQCTLSGPSWTLRISLAAEAAYAWRDGETVPLRLPRAAFGELQVEAQQFRPRSLIAEEAVDALRIDIQEDGHSRRLERGVMVDAWTERSSAMSDLEASEIAIELRSALAHLEVREFVRKGQEVGTASRSIHVAFEAHAGPEARRYEIELAPRPHADDCFVRLADEPWGVAEAESCQHLLRPVP